MSSRTARRARVEVVESFVAPGRTVEEISTESGFSLSETYYLLQRITRREVGRARKAGAMRPPDRCADCGATERIHGHHPDYTKPLEVEWLCPRCHRTRHPKHTPSVLRRLDQKAGRPRCYG